MTDTDSPLIQVAPSPIEQAKERARDDLDNQDLWNMVHDLPGIVYLQPNGEDEDWRRTTVSVGFDDYRTRGEVTMVFQRAGWQVDDVVFEREEIRYELPGSAEVDDVE